jgi:hypothetical protein
MFTSMWRRWSAFRNHKARDFEHAVQKSLDDLYRVAFFLSGDEQVAKHLVVRAYGVLCNERERHGRIDEIRTHLLRRVVALAEEVPRITALKGVRATRTPETACLFRLPKALRIVVVLDVLGMKAEAIAEVIGVPIATVRTRQQAGWDLLCAAWAEKAQGSCAAGES